MFWIFKKWVYEICKSLYSVLFYILQSSKIFLDVGLYFKNQSLFAGPGTL